MNNIFTRIIMFELLEVASVNCYQTNEYMMMMTMMMRG